ncbi:hypothetical protein LINPERHAP1_LOCUS29449 [Linum perenne]
MRNWLIPT